MAAGAARFINKGPIYCMPNELAKHSKTIENIFSEKSHELEGSKFQTQKPILGIHC